MEDVPSVPGYLICLIMVSVFFCFPIAIGSLISYHNAATASESNDKTNYEKSIKLSRQLSITAIIVGALAIITGFVILHFFYENGGFIWGV